MSELNAKSAALKQYRELSTSKNIKLTKNDLRKISPLNPDLRSMNSKQIFKAIEKLNNKEAKALNSKKVKYPSKASMWKALKKENKTGNLTYKSASAKQLYDNVIKFDKSFKSTIVTEAIKNPINGKNLTPAGLNLFKKVGYTVKDNKLVAPSNKMILKDVLNSNGDIIYPITEKSLKKYKSGLVFYRLIGISGKSSPIISESFSITNRMSATKAINQIKYSKGVDDVEIVKVELYGPKLGSSYHGIAYRDSGDKNCVISALENVLSKDLTTLHERYSIGVSQDDYLDIAKALKIELRVDVAGEKIMYNKANKKRIIDLVYLNNHCIAKSKNTDDIPIVKHDSLDPMTINDIFKTDSVNNIINIIKIGDNVTCVETTTAKHQLSKQVIDGHDIEIVGDMMTATSEYKVAFLQINKICSNTILDAKNYCRHGIKILKTNFEEGYTIDLRSAYNNFMKWPCYDGMPLDITFDVKHSDEHLDTILQNYAGFGLVTWKSYFLDTMETRWASIPHIKSRLAKGHSIVFHKWNLAFRKGNLDMSLFDGKYKRLWQYVVGSLSKVQSYESKATTDPILANTLGMSLYGQINGTDVYYGKTKELEVKCFYTHISAYVQSYTEIMMEDKFDQVDSWWGIYVDGISTNMNYEELEHHEDQFWAVKPNKAFTSFDSVIDMSYMDIEVKDNGNDFVDIGVYGSGCIKIIDGPAGSGKSTLFKKIQKMSDAIILVQNNTQREIYADHPCMTVDMYIAKSIYYKFVLVDEYYQMDSDKLAKLKMALLVGNCSQLAISKNIIDYRKYEHRLLTEVYRCNKELDEVANKILDRYDISDLKYVDIEQALLDERTILASTHEIIEKINDIGLALDLPRKIRFTTTNLKKDIWAGDMGVFKNGVCVNERNGLEYNIKPGRIIKCKCKDKCNCKPLVVYAYARTYHSTQGKEFNDIVLCYNNCDASTLYTGITRVHSLDEVNICYLEC